MGREGAEGWLPLCHSRGALTPTPQVEKGEKDGWQKKASSLATDVELLQEQWNKVSDHLRGDLRTRKSEMRARAARVRARAEISKDSSDSFLALLGQAGQVDIQQILKQSHPMHQPTSHSASTLEHEQGKRRFSSSGGAAPATAAASDTVQHGHGVAIQHGHGSALPSGIKRSPRAPGTDFLGSLRRPEQT